jgi:hypothetical protein
VQGDPATGDARAAGAAIGYEHVAVDENRALTEFGQVDRLPKGAANQALNLMGAAAKLAADRLTIGAGVGGARQHAVFGGDPAGPLAAKVWWHALFDGGGADHHGVADRDDGGTLGPLLDTEFNL